MMAPSWRNCFAELVSSSQGSHCLIAFIVFSFTCPVTTALLGCSLTQSNARLGAAQTLLDRHAPFLPVSLFFHIISISGPLSACHVDTLGQLDIIKQWKDVSARCTPIPDVHECRRTQHYGLEALTLSQWSFKALGRFTTSLETTTAIWFIAL